MKKVLSVLLAAAMVAGMSVSSFAADFSKPAASNGDEVCVDNIKWGAAHLVDVDGKYKDTVSQGVEGTEVKVDFDAMVEGEAIYFEILEKEIITHEHDEDCYETVYTCYPHPGMQHAPFCPSTKELVCEEKAEVIDYDLLNQLVPKNWVMKIENSEYINDEKTELVYVTAAKAKEIGIASGVYAKVVMNDEFKAQDEEEAENELEFFMYIWDTTCKKASEKATVHFAFAEYAVETITKEMAKHVIVAKKDTYYKLAKGINSLEVVFSLDGDVYVTAKMWKGEKYMVKSDVDAVWSKELSKEYDTDIEVLTIKSDLDIREVLWEAKKDNKQVVELVDGVLVSVESEYVTKYEVIEDVVLAKGYIAETEAGSYALIDATIELIVPEVEAEPEVEADKANPETGAADFVGAAVAMAVVSVAAAGALALKK